MFVPHVQVLPSLMEGATLRINTYSTVPPAATVNCARMVSVNQHSTFGVVHSIDKVLQPVTKSLAELLVSDPRFSILYQCECSELLLCLSPL